MSRLTSRGPTALWGAIAAIVAVVVVGVAIAVIEGWHHIPQTPTVVEETETSIGPEDLTIAPTVTPVDDPAGEIADPGAAVSQLPGLGAIGGPGQHSDVPRFLPPVESDALGGAGSMGTSGDHGAETP